LKKGDKVILHTEKVNKIEDLVFKPDIHKEFQDFMKQADKTGTVERIKVNGKEVDEFFGYGNKTFDIIYVDVKFGSNIIKRIPGYALEKVQ